MQFQHLLRHKILIFMIKLGVVNATNHKSFNELVTKPFQASDLSLIDLI